MSVFARFAPRLQEAIVARLGWTSLRPVQEQAGAALLDGKNAVVLAPTAGGKTEAAIFPILSQLVAEPPRGVAAIYVAPIKALLNNQAERLGLYTEMVGLSRFVWHGDTPDNERRRFLREPTELLMTTPESLEVMLVSRRVDARSLFGSLRFVVVDEVHAVAGTDRGAHLMSVVERIARLSEHDVQRVGLSATVGNPTTILTWLRGTSEREGVVVEPPQGPARRQLLVVHHEDLAAVAADAAKVARGSKSLFFCQSRSMTEAVAEYMRRAGTSVFVHHSAVSREERALAEERFHHGSDACIVATSTLELGIDVGDLDLVLQAEAPDTVSSFLQRMGRTGRRAGKAANTTFFCQTTEGVLQAAALIELARSRWVESIEISGRCWPVLIHQLLAMSLATDGVTAEDAWTHLSKIPDFQGIHRAEFDRLVAWMLRDGSLRLAVGQLVIGPKAERRFGRRNFMELYAVFSSPQSYTVEMLDGRALGTLSQGFVDRLVDGVSSFLLGGRGWAVVRILHDDRRIQVEPAPRGRQPTWGGFLPQFLGFEVCQQQLTLLTADRELAYLHPTARDVLTERRAAFDGVLDGERGGIEVEDGEIRWWTFAGGRINSTLRYALEAVGPEWKVVPDNFLVRIRGEGIARADLDRAVDCMRDPEFWEDDKLWTEVAAGLPNYRLSKFQPLMPPWVEREVVASYLLDVRGAWMWLSGGSLTGLERVPRAVHAVRGDEALGAPADPMPPRQPLIRPTLPVHWVDHGDRAAEVCELLRQERVVGLDVETTPWTRALCLVQVAGAGAVYLLDVLALENLDPLADLLADRQVTKVIHNAGFERSVLGRHGIALENVVDTVELSRRRHGRDAPGGHSLKAVCQRELGLEVDKFEQVSDWSRRPLSESQIAYAALDAEVLLRLYDRMRPVPRSPDDSALR